MPDDESLEMTLQVPNDAGTLKVIWSPDDDIWYWTILTSKGQLIQNGMNLQIAVGHTARDAMKVLVQFCLLAADRPLSDFYDATNVWAVTRRQELRKALQSL